MPTYEYRCPAGHTFEVFQRMSDEPGATCPECGKAAERLISTGAGFLFKGEGFYITDYRSEEYRKKASAEAGGAPEQGAGKGGTGDKEGKGSGAPAAGDQGGAGDASSGAKKGGSAPKPPPKPSGGEA